MTQINKCKLNNPWVNFWAKNKYPRIFAVIKKVEDNFLKFKKKERLKLEIYDYFQIKKQPKKNILFE
jgi:hypothetical protein